MPAVAENYAYVVKVTDKNKEIPLISRERLEEAKIDAASLRKAFPKDCEKSQKPGSAEQI